MKCLNCQKELTEQAMFCTGCGKKIPRCPTCGNLLTRRVRFCPRDGAAIPQEILELIPAAAPAPTPAQKSFCTRCGKPTAPGQKICDACRGGSSQTATAKKPAKTVTRAAKKEAGTKKNRLWLVLIPVILVILLGLGALGYFAVTNDWLDFSWLEDLGIHFFQDDREEEKDERDEEDEEDEDTLLREEAVAETAAPTEAPAEDVPATEAPPEENPVTEPPATEPPATEPSATEATTQPDPLAVLEVGDTFFLGSFEQDNTESNGPEDIEWIVLEKSDDRILVTSRYLLDCRRYHSKNVSVSWATCSLRTWLNETFYQDAFTASEKERILTFSDPDSVAEDKVFLLSLEQVEQYFTTKSSRICRATKYAVSRNAYVNSSTGGSWWLLRTAGVDDQHVVSVNSDGTIDYTGGKVADNRGTVRPALWIRIG